MAPSFYIWYLWEMVREAGYSKNLTEDLYFYGRIGDELEKASMMADSIAWAEGMIKMDTCLRVD